MNILTHRTSVYAPRVLPGKAPLRRIGPGLSAAADSYRAATRKIARLGALDTSAADVRSVLAGFGITFAADAPLDKIAFIIRKHGSTAPERYEVNNHVIACLNANLPDPHSLGRIILHYGLERAQKMDAGSKISKSFAARRVFQLQDQGDRVAEDQLRDLMEEHGIEISKDGEKIICHLNHVERSFAISLKTSLPATETETVPFHSFRARIMKEIYTSLCCDLEATSQRLGDIPLETLRRSLVEAGVEFKIPDAFKAYSLPAAAVRIPGPFRENVLEVVQHLMADLLRLGSARLQRQLPYERDAMVQRLRDAVVRELTTPVTDVALSAEELHSIADDAWVLLNGALIMLHSHSLQSPTADFARILTAAIESRLEILWPDVPAYVEKARKTNGKKPVRPGARITRDTLTALYLPLRRSSLFPYEDFSERDLTALEDPNLPLAEQKVLLKKMARALEKPIVFDAAEILPRARAGLGKEVTSENKRLQDLVGEIRATQEALHFLFNTRRLHFFAIKDERQERFRQEIRKVYNQFDQFLQTFAARKGSFKGEEIANAYVECVGAVAGLIETYQAMRQYTQSTRSRMRLYHQLYHVHHFPDFTLLGNLPKEVGADRIVAASLFVPRVEADLWKHIPAPHRAYFVCYPEEAVHVFHLSAALEQMHLNGWITIQAALTKAAAPLTPAKADLLKEKAKLLGMPLSLRLRIAQNPKTGKPLIFLCDRDSTSFYGGQNRIFDGDTGQTKPLLELAHEILAQKLGVPADHIVELTTAEEPKTTVEFLKMIQDRFGT